MPDERRPYDEKLELILREAASIFAEKGYHDTSVRDISRATGISLSGLYYYFSSKEELLFLIQDHCFLTLAEKLEGVLSSESDPMRRFQRMVENHLRYFVSNMKEMKVLSHELDTLKGDFRSTVNAKKHRYTELCAQVLVDIAPSRSTIDSRVALYGLFGMMNWIYNWYHPERDVPVAKLAHDMSQLFLRGYLSADLESRATAAAADPRSKVRRA